MWGDGNGFSHPSSRGQALRGNNALLLHQSPRLGDGSPHPRGQRVGMGPRIRVDNEGGWVPASVFMGAGSPRGDGDGFRIRVDNEGGWVPASVLHGGRFSAGGRGWVPHLPRGQRAGGDGSPHPRGQRVGMGSASARTTRGMGPRIREDNAWGWVNASAKATGRGGGWVCTPILTFPPQGGREVEGWVHVGAGTTGGGCGLFQAEALQGRNYLGQACDGGVGFVVGGGLVGVGFVVGLRRDGQPRRRGGRP